MSPASALDRFQPQVRTWFTETLGEPTAPQREGWPAIEAGEHTLIAAPTGTGKTLAAFLWALDGLLRQGDELPDTTQVLYVSPLRALSNDVQKNLDRPLATMREQDPSLPDVRVLVRTGDTTSSQRASMLRRKPHVLVTTPESLYILLTSDGGRSMLRGVRTVIVDEIHALARDKRGSHLALSLERLDALTGGVQRIGLSATQKPLERVARLLVGDERECTLVDTGHLRHLDVAVEVPPSPLSAVCSHEQWGEIYAAMAGLIEAHRTTLIFVGTRKLAERLAARLTDAVGADLIACHHGSLSKEMRFDAEQRLKEGTLKALVATASLELGIDIGDVDLVIQVGSARSIATLLQRVGRAGHGVNRIPKGRVFPLTQDELVEAAALMVAIQRGELDATPTPPPALDILAQQIVAACVPHDWDEGELFNCLRRAAPYRELTREVFDEVVALHTEGRWALLHRDGVGGRLLATKRARIPSMTSGGAIPDTADYDVRLEPEGLRVGTLNEDFAVEANVGDIFQLGNTSWRILRVEPGVVRVADARGEPPTLPFWLGEAPSRTVELSAALSELRENYAGEVRAVSRPPPTARDAAHRNGQTQGDADAGLVPLSADIEAAVDPEVVARVESEVGLGHEAACQLVAYLSEGKAALGVVPTQKRLVAERFFDETGGMQLVIHTPFGGRINRAWGLALRKRFCRGFGFELQAAATEECILLSLGPQHSFELEGVFRYLNSATSRDLLVQALLAAPMFTTRWRWNVTRSLMLPRTRGGKRVPPPLLRMRADDLLTQAFPQVMACGETLPPGDIPVPDDHAMVRQTIEDCLTEIMDIDGLLGLLKGLESGAIETVAVDLPEPSPFSLGILSAQPYSFLDDAPLEERRTQAVRSRRGLDTATADTLGALDPEAVARVREQAWPRPADAEEVHEVLLWMGYVSDVEAVPWRPWLEQLAAAGRVVHEDDRWFASEASREPLEVLRGRLEALGPVVEEDLGEGAVAVLAALEAEGAVLRTRLDGRSAWCNRRLLARIHRDTLDKLRAQIQPVSAAELMRFLARWQHVDPERRLEGPRGVLAVVEQLAGFEAPAASWETSLLPARVRGYRPGWLDEVMLSGQVTWGRLWGAASGPVRSTPVSLFPRADLEAWHGLAIPGDAWSLKGPGRQLHEVLAARGACFPQELARHARLLPAQVEEGLAQLIGLGLVTCDGFGGLRELLARRRPQRRRGGPVPVGRWSLFRQEVVESPSVEFVVRQLLKRTGILFRKLLEREKLPVTWREMHRVLRVLEVRGEVRGGRFVAGFSGEQFALPEAVTELRSMRREGEARSGEPITVIAADPLNLVGILTPDERVASNAHQRVAVA